MPRPSDSDDIIHERFISVSDFLGTLAWDVKSARFYIAQYPVLRTAQSAFILYFPDSPVQSDTISTSVGSIQLHATINVRKAARTHSDE